MPSFDVVSEVDRQELKNAVDQAQRELANRFDFKNTDSSIEQNDLVLTLRTASEDRLRALRLLLEEKLVKRQVSLKGIDWGKVKPVSLQSLPKRNGFIAIFGQCEGFTYYLKDGQDGGESKTKTIFTNTHKTDPKRYIEE